MEGMLLPYDNQRGPNCGITALAVIAGISFTQAVTVFTRRYPKRANWKGRTTSGERSKVLNDLGYSWVDAEPYRRMTLETWVICYSQPRVRYIVRTTGHVQVVKDGRVTDQFQQAVKVRLHRGRRKMVTCVTTIEEV